MTYEQTLLNTRHFRSKSMYEETIDSEFTDRAKHDEIHANLILEFCTLEVMSKWMDEETIDSEFTDRAKHDEIPSWNFAPSR